MILAKKCQPFLYLDLVKITLQIMLNYFEEKKKPFLTIKNRIFQSPKNRIFFFQRGLTHAFGQKMPFFSLFRLDKNKTTNKAF